MTEPQTQRVSDVYLEKLISGRYATVPKDSQDALLDLRDARAEIKALKSRPTDGIRTCSVESLKAERARHSNDDSFFAMLCLMVNQDVAEAETERDELKAEHRWFDEWLKVDGVEVIKNLSEVYETRKDEIREMRLAIEASCGKTMSDQKHELRQLKAQGPYRSAMLRCRDLAKSVFAARYTSNGTGYGDNLSEEIEEYVRDLCAMIEGEVKGDSGEV